MRVASLPVHLDYAASAIDEPGFAGAWLVLDCGKANLFMGYTMSVALVLARQTQRWCGVGAIQYLRLAYIAITPATGFANYRKTTG